MPRAVGHRHPGDQLTRLILQSQALLTASKEYENNKWKVIGQKVGKPAKVRIPFPRLLPLTRIRCIPFRTWN